MSVLETGTQANLDGTISLIYNLVIDLAVSTMFFLSPMLCVKETVAYLLQGLTQMIHCLVQ